MRQFYDLVEVLFISKMKTWALVHRHTAVCTKGPFSQREIAFQSFTPKKIADHDTVEALFSFACESADEVRAMSERAFELGAKQVNEPTDLGFMFSWGFEDLDGHLWDLFWMNPEHVQ